MLESSPEFLHGLFVGGGVFVKGLDQIAGLVRIQAENQLTREGHDGYHRHPQDRA
jgi:hypothetical protein